MDGERENWAAEIGGNNGWREWMTRMSSFE